MKQLKLIVNDDLPLRDVVFQTIRRAILVGDLMQGERLMEIHLAKQLGVSRTPIREAIHMLEQEGLVVIIPRRGAEVAGISKQGLEDVLEVRRALDVLCAELACDRISDEEIAALKNACENFAVIVSKQDADASEVAASDVALHEIILNATGNARLKALIDNLAEQMYRYRFEYIKDVSRYPILVEEHRTICDAISRRDRCEAARIAAVHIDNQQQAILDRIALEKSE